MPHVEKTLSSLAPAENDEPAVDVRLNFSDIVEIYFLKLRHVNLHKYKSLLKKEEKKEKKNIKRHISRLNLSEINCSRLTSCRIDGAGVTVREIALAQSLIAFSKLTKWIFTFGGNDVFTIIVTVDDRGQIRATREEDVKDNTRKSFGPMRV